MLTLSFDPAMGAFDEEPLRRFLADKELLSQQNHFFVVREQPFLALVLEYRLPHSSVAEGRTPSSSRKSETANRWRELLTADDWPLFNTLREWRSQRAKEEGIPRYVICSNLQLAQAVRARPRTLAQLAQIDGFGKAKLERYGSEMVSLLAGATGTEEKARGSE